MILAAGWSDPASVTPKASKITSLEQYDCFLGDIAQLRLHDILGKAFCQTRFDHLPIAT